MKPERIFLIGFMATGKTTVGRALAARLKLPMFDLDDQIVTAHGRTIASFFAQEGEAYFREIEAKILRDVARQPKFVLATGGGTPCFSDNIDFMLSQGIVVALSASQDEIGRRSELGPPRPLLMGSNPSEKIEALLNQRSSFYSRAQIQVETTGHSVDTIVDTIENEIGRR